MRFLSNAHTHTTYCDGKTAIPDMAAAARALGFVSLGFSGHAAQGFDEAYSMMGGRQEQYRRELRALQRDCRARGELPRLWVGLELDAMAKEAWKRDAYENFDYVIGSAHYLCLDYGGQCVGVDGDPRLLERYVEEVFQGDGLAMARRYYQTHVGALLRDRPAVIGHFDLVRKYAASLRLFDELGTAYRRLALEALEQAVGCGGVLEINTGGMARGYMDAPYPSAELLGAWRELGGKVTITSDCHDARYLNFAFEDAALLARRAGYRSVMRLGTGDSLWEEVGLR